MREELRNNFEEAQDDFLRRFEIILEEIVVVNGEIDVMGREFIECMARSIWTRLSRAVNVCMVYGTRNCGNEDINCPSVLNSTPNRRARPPCRLGISFYTKA